MNDLAKTIAQACLEEIQRRPDTPTVDELAEVVRPLVPEMGWDLAEGPISKGDGVERVYNGTDWYCRRSRLPQPEGLPWDKLRDPIADGPEHPSPAKPPSSELIRQAYERVRDTHLPPPPVPRAIQEMMRLHDELIEQYLNSIKWPATGTFMMAPDGSIREIEDADLYNIPPGTKAE